MVLASHTDHKHDYQGPAWITSAGLENKKSFFQVELMKCLAAAPENASLVSEPVLGCHRKFISLTMLKKFDTPSISTVFLRVLNDSTTIAHTNLAQPHRPLLNPPYFEWVNCHLLLGPGSGLLTKSSTRALSGHQCHQDKRSLSHVTVECNWRQKILQRDRVQREEARSTEEGFGLKNASDSTVESIDDLRAEPKAGELQKKGLRTTMSRPPPQREELVTKGMNKRDLAMGGRVPVIFYDLKVVRVVNELVKNSTDGLNESLGEDGGLKADMVSISVLAKASPLLNSADGSFFLRDQNAIQRQLKDLLVPQQSPPMDRCPTSEAGTTLVYHVEFHNTKDADVAYIELRSEKRLGVKGNVFGEIEACQPIPETIEFPNISLRQLLVNLTNWLIFCNLKATKSRPRPPAQANCYPVWEQGANLRMRHHIQVHIPSSPHHINPPAHAYHLSSTKNLVPTTMVLTGFAPPTGLVLTTSPSPGGTNVAGMPALLNGGYNPRDESAALFTNIGGRSHVFTLLPTARVREPPKHLSKPFARGVLIFIFEDGLYERMQCQLCLGIEKPRHVRWFSPHLRNTLGTESSKAKANGPGG
ncbi:hypothetical protein CPB83DRAFT_841142 [Crepidotus variabilis]|uniref:Uncharacterized protein n=1 Tax=Crepidotus variabilis TaxID=179855 RepID=A0A9P6E321_9AGAR|nr:hypothetical protein CPB83DRAFT_841142 [Crepidotus variabilis]